MLLPVIVIHPITTQSVTIALFSFTFCWPSDYFWCTGWPSKNRTFFVDYCSRWEWRFFIKNVQEVQNTKHADS